MDKEFYDITMEKANGSLMAALENQIQEDVGGTKEQANVLACHILDIFDAHSKYSAGNNIKLLSPEEVRSLKKGQSVMIHSKSGGKYYAMTLYRDNESITFTTENFTKSTCKFKNYERTWTAYLLPQM